VHKARVAEIAVEMDCWLI